MEAEWKARLTAGPAGSETSAVGTRFDAGGRPLRFGGNTVVCHVPVVSALWRDLAALGGALAALPSAGSYAFLPPESYHMTVFGGVTANPDRVEVWPEGVPAATPRAAIDRLFIERLAGMRAPQRFRMRPAALRPMGTGGTVLELVPADEDELRRIRGLREALALRLGIREANHDAYAFHITFSYLLRHLSAEAAEAQIADHARLVATFRTARPVIELGPPEFCLFSTLERFLPVAWFDA
ncbi:DUF1868 domain-containing protein [Prosthecomicrobium pneumaticum]|uniref:DUF1868 domain-containing protein n=1 Tax=Prosthecomicrobium pneumaticum TaxID=81895 RepID=A0A7W9CUD8_9HYPH|nr:DUF1868 domain-containing protein [Prosthecomicrobium pneumaticum]MBB5751834.1 hypothetical protein [Prosthecomicrobium pneumaticum]